MSVDTTSRLVTADEYLRMWETGQFSRENRVELLDGEIVPMLPLGPWHCYTTMWLMEFFNDHRGDRWCVAAGASLLLGDYDVPEPDISLLRPPQRRYRAALPTAKDAFLVIEVSDSSLRQDRTRKARIYAQAGIPEYWIVSKPDRAVQVLRSRSGGTYNETFMVAPGDPLAPEAFPDVVIDTADLFAE